MASNTYSRLLQEAATGIEVAERHLHIAESLITPPPARSRDYPATRPEVRRARVKRTSELFPPDCKGALKAVLDAGGSHGRGAAALQLIIMVGAYSEDVDLRDRARATVARLAPRYGDFAKLLPLVAASVGRACLTPERLTELGALAETYARFT